MLKKNWLNNIVKTLLIIIMIVIVIFGIYHIIKSDTFIIDKISSYIQKNSSDIGFNSAISIFGISISALTIIFSLVTFINFSIRKKNITFRYSPKKLSVNDGILIILMFFYIFCNLGLSIYFLVIGEYYLVIGCCLVIIIFSCGYFGSQFLNFFSKSDYGYLEELYGIKITNFEILYRNARIKKRLKKIIKPILECKSNKSTANNNRMEKSSGVRDNLNIFVNEIDLEYKNKILTRYAFNNFGNFILYVLSALYQNNDCENELNYLIYYIESLNKLNAIIGFKIIEENHDKLIELIKYLYEVKDYYSAMSLQTNILFILVPEKLRNKFFNENKINLKPFQNSKYKNGKMDYISLYLYIIFVLNKDNIHDFYIHKLDDSYFKLFSDIYNDAIDIEKIFEDNKDEILRDGSDFLRQFFNNKVRKNQIKKFKIKKNDKVIKYVINKINVINKKI